ncbi:MAG TPA: carboxypeptidase M32 [Planctomycetaceae bacterium]|jgi:carboxypeptidase Taq|nr:carboxypeptidase M32 [Planctomycetaceae bacterium]
MAATQALYDELLDSWRKATLLGSVQGQLGWDEQTYLPAGGAAHRADQMSLLAGMVHQQLTAPRLGELIGALETGDKPTGSNGLFEANVREARRRYDRLTKLPTRLVEELTRVTSLAQQNWVEARKKSNFAMFQPWLEKIVGLKREEAAALGGGNGVPYDVLLDEYEPGGKTADVAKIFAALREALVPLVQAIANAKKRPDDSILTRRYPKTAQAEFATAAAAAIGFSFQDGRLDVSPHPFCSGNGPGDCRLTTRYDEHHFPCAFFGVLHEAGHGLYEQGLDRKAFGTPIGDAASLGIHESQSRMWENFVGRSQAFWKHFYSPAQTTFPEALGSVPRDAFYAAVNSVEPSFIRVEADEVTYNLHIMIRFELEQQLISGKLQPADVPAAWNDQYTHSLGITPSNDAEGCLQDIHWSGGGLGYFPTYALGNMYAAQLFETARKDVGDLDAQFAKGEFAPLRDWLRVHVHRLGRQYLPAQLIEKITGKPLSHEPLVAHLKAKFEPLYGL